MHGLGWIGSGWVTNLRLPFGRLVSWVGLGQDYNFFGKMTD